MSARHHQQGFVIPELPDPQAVFPGFHSQTSVLVSRAREQVLLLLRHEWRSEFIRFAAKPGVQFGGAEAPQIADAACWNLSLPGHALESFRVDVAASSLVNVGSNAIG